MLSMLTLVNMMLLSADEADHTVFYTAFIALFYSTDRPSVLDRVASGVSSDGEAAIGLFEIGLRLFCTGLWLFLVVYLVYVTFVSTLHGGYRLTMLLVRQPSDLRH